jgi:hypothetical protein
MYEIQSSLQRAPTVQSSNSNQTDVQTFTTVSMTPKSYGCMVLFGVFPAGTLTSTPSSPWILSNDGLANDPVGAYQYEATNGTAYSTTWTLTNAGYTNNFGLVIAP